MNALDLLIKIVFGLTAEPFYFLFAFLFSVEMRFELIRVDCGPIDHQSPCVGGGREWSILHSLTNHEGHTSSPPFIHFSILSGQQLLEQKIDAKS